MGEFSSTEGNFAANFPAQPGRANQKIDTPNGLIDLFSFAAEVGGSGFVITYGDLPAATVAGTDRASAILSDLTHAWTQQAKVENLQTEAIALGVYPGRRASYDLVNGLHMEGRAYLVGQRLYQIFTLYRPESIGASDRAAAFQSSFRLLNTPGTRP